MSNIFDKGVICFAIILVAITIASCIYGYIVIRRNGRKNYE